MAIMSSSYLATYDGKGSPDKTGSADSPATDGEPANCWETCLDFAKQFAAEDMEVWKDEVDKLLIFAGLFSGVVASFATESYRNLKKDPAETTVLLLKNLLILQLNATNPQQGFAGIDTDPVAQPVSNGNKRAAIYHFLSLVLTISTAIAGILCLQWIREYSRNPVGVPGSRREHLGVRFMRHEGMEHYHVFTCLTVLPLLLIISLLLFFIGLVEMLFEVNDTVAVVALVMAGITFTFVLITTLLPSVQPWTKYSQCPYKSPQAWLFYQLTKVLRALFHYAMALIRRQRPDGTTTIRNLAELSLWSWSDYDARAYKDLMRHQAANVGLGLHWLGGMYLQHTKFGNAFYKCVQDESIQNLLYRVLERGDSHRAEVIASIPGSLPAQQAVLEDGSSQDSSEVFKQSVTIFQTLSYLVEKIEQDQPSSILLRERLNLFLEIKAKSGFQEDVGYLLISDDDIQKLLSRGMIDQDTPYIRKYLDAVQIILRLEQQAPSPRHHIAFDKTVDALSAWLARRGSDLKDDSRELMNRVRGLRNHVNLLGRMAKPKHHSRAARSM
ncbi:hypothetical protein NP233_g9739 [Leucocoprinus birnbaumii]|uniref:DUF6535 domain-containing protein n=1 Tax=Leucocoprinus birnbaumii TaxID=56174 RepID=A0AAD5VLL7_9AGAR|nr:hypothetical protein NP233_g9739 [Leucocoprinus birnbaumii]